MYNNLEFLFSSMTACVSSIVAEFLCAYMSRPSNRLINLKVPRTCRRRLTELFFIMLLHFYKKLNELNEQSTGVLGTGD